MHKILVSLVLATGICVGGCSKKKEPPLVRIDANALGFTDQEAQAIELERSRNTSKIKVTFAKRGGSVGDSMFVMMAICEVAKARGYEYFTNLNDWDADGGWIYIAGFTNDGDADIKKEFGDEYDCSNESWQSRTYMSVSELQALFGNK